MKDVGIAIKTAISRAMVLCFQQLCVVVDAGCIHGRLETLHNVRQLDSAADAPEHAALCASAEVMDDSLPPCSLHGMAELTRDGMCWECREDAVAQAGFHGAAASTDEDEADDFPAAASDDGCVASDGGGREEWPE